jgi:formate dehydrogenase maturation protein FdhE
MEQWQRRVEHAEELARRFPFSAELMYFYRDIMRAKAAMQGQDATPLLAIGGTMGMFFSRLIEGESPAYDCGHALRRVHQDAEFPHIRVEACDTCGIYRKVFDDPSPFSDVDDLASVPLDLWAVEHGYRKPTPNLFGL